MKIKNIIAAFLFTVVAISSIQAQTDIFMSAMNKEIKRSMDSLKLENMQKPVYISYTISNAHTLQIKASLGAIIKSNETQICQFNNRVLVGENGKTNENYVDLSNLWSYNYFNKNVPINGSETDVRRSFWLTTDDNYKTAVTNYEAKMAALSKQSFSDEDLSLGDFGPASKCTLRVPYSPLNYQKSDIEKTAKELSSVFLRFPEILRSEVNIFVFDAEVSFASSEGTNVSYPVQIVAVKVFARAQFPGGEDAVDHVLWFAPSMQSLPDKKTMLNECNLMGQNLTKLLTAPAISESYSGPVLFEDQAAAEIFVQLMFESSNGLVSSRKPIAGSDEVISYRPDLFKENDLAQMMNKKIVSRDLTIEAQPTLKEENGIALIGSFQVDAEGVLCADTLTLVKNGVLVNLLSNRTPSSKVFSSNGHCRTGLSNGSVTGCTGPGVIRMTNNNPATIADKAKMKQMLIDAAKEEDLEYAYIIRKIESQAAAIPVDGMQIFFGGSASTESISNTIAVYRVKVSDGSEELVSLAKIQGLTARSFKRIIATSSTQMVYNTLVFPFNNKMYSYQFELSGIPASFILPDAILFQEIDIVKTRQNVVKQKPVVVNPLK